MRNNFFSRKKRVLPFLFVSVVVFLIGCLLFFKLSSIPPGFSESELRFLSDSSSISAIADKPVFAPYKLIHFGLLSFDISNAWAFRVVSSVFAVLLIICMYTIFKRHFSVRVSLLSIALFATSSWFLHTARIIEPILFYPLGTAFLLAFWARSEDTSHYSWLHVMIICMGISGLLFIPGFILLLLVLLTLYIKPITHFMLHAPKSSLLVGMLIFLLSFAFIIYSIVFRDASVSTILGIPELSTVVEPVRRFILIPVYIIARGPLEPTINLARLPLLDIFASILLFFGMYAFYIENKNPFLRYAIVVGILSSLFIAFHGNTYISIMLPIVFVFVARGMQLMLQQWFTVFPKNPVARSLGVFLLTITVILTSSYHIQRYFIAWGNSPVTQTTFQKSIYKPPLIQ